MKKYFYTIIGRMEAEDENDASDQLYTTMQGHVERFEITQIEEDK